ncbi:hypothetical protein [Rickettsia endosymbiont of Cantharis rufa]|uniref:hypothetical protein n=1 Tax=Rickettsia endosymbiont of Cantharis rufa TaxID=3066248 RepID=UPI00313339DF
MKITKSKANILFSALNEWNNAGLLDDNTTILLKKNNIEILNFDWKKLARYSFWLSLICIVTAISAILSDHYLRELLAYIFNAPYLLKFITLSILSGVIYFGRTSILQMWILKGYTFNKSSDDFIMNIQ